MATPFRPGAFDDEVAPAASPFGLAPLLGPQRPMGVNPYAPQTPLDQNEILANQLLAQMTQRTLDAQSASTQAASDYTSAAAAPTPNVFNERPVAAAGAMGLSRIAEGLGRAEAPAQVRQTIGDQQKALTTRRVENLKALQTHYDALADRAAKLGDLESAAKQKALSDRAAREQAKLLAGIREEGDNARTAATISAANQRAKDQNATTLTAAGIRASNNAASKGIGPKGYTNAQLNQMGSLTSRINANKDLTTFTRVRDAYTTGIDAAKRNNSLGDIMLMRMIAKVSDPDTGVREEEFRTFEKAQGELAKWGVQLTRSMWGKGRLNDFGRAEMHRSLQDIYTRKRDIARNARGMFGRQAEIAGLDPNDVLYGIDPAGELGAVQGQGGGAIGAPGAPAAAAGGTIRMTKSQPDGSVRTINVPAAEAAEAEADGFVRAQ